MSDANPSLPDRGARGHVVGWQGWRLTLPRRWDPVKLDGDAAAGHALFADALRPRLGLKWQTPRGIRRWWGGRRPVDGAAVAAAVRRTMVDEVGRLAAAEARACEPPDGGWGSALLYVEPDPPGRDVWVGYSRASGRLLSVACHARRRGEQVLDRLVLPTLADDPLDRAAPWSVYDLSLVAPGGFALTGQRLNAGDLALSFADRRGATLAVRQIAVAGLALSRRPIDGWIADQQRTDRRHHRAGGPVADVTLTVAGRPAHGRVSQLVRRRRFALATWHPKSITTLAVHDVERDRVVLLQGTDGDLLRAVAETVGIPSGPVRRA